MHSPMTLRELRLWHWRKVKHHRAQAEKYDQYTISWEDKYPGKRCSHSRRMARSNHSIANWHLGAVQVLNDCFPIGDTALIDDERYPK